MSDWSPGAYARFRGLRLRPALDLLARVPDLPDGTVVDLGCGDGAMAEVLRHRAGGRALIGVDLSPAMLLAAAESGRYDRLDAADLVHWTPGEPPALIFSNAALQWLPDHRDLLPKLAGYLLPGGTLAVQMPRQYEAPSHALLREIAARRHPERFAFGGWTPPVGPPAAYARLLEPLGDVAVWETEYLQRLPATADGHPIRRFTEATAMRPFLEQLTADEAEAFTAEYEDSLGLAYPREADGSVLFPFRRLFVLLTRAG